MIAQAKTRKTQNFYPYVSKGGIKSASIFNKIPLKIFEMSEL
jgi:hypothetical protein